MVMRVCSLRGTAIGGIEELALSKSENGSGILDNWYTYMNRNKAGVKC